MSARPKLSRADRALVEAALSTSARDTGQGKTRVGCPLCERIRGKTDTKQSLYLHADGGWVCFRCAAAGWLPGTGSNAGGAWAGHVGIDARTEVLDPTQADAWKHAPEGFTELYDDAGLESRSLQFHRDYLAHRGIDPHVAKLARIGGVVSGRLAGHVVVPVFAPIVRGVTADRELDQWWGWVARTLYPSPNPYAPVYREPAGAPKGTYFYRGEILAIETSSPAFVVEGVFDALPLWPDAVACLGKVVGAQFSLLCASRRPVVFIPDGDAWRAGDGLMLALRAAVVRAGCLRLPPKTDPDEIPVHVLRAASEASLSAWESVYVEPPREEV